MKAIITKFHGPTNTKGSRISASDMDGNRIYHNYRHSLNSEQNHWEAAYKLVDKMKWWEDGVIGNAWPMVAGAIKGGYAFVIVERK
jgi:hypothetical protein